jgi:hypothetical protein
MSAEAAARMTTAEDMLERKSPEAKDLSGRHVVA